ncbi:MAG TPA: DUF4097 family beta strand repeat-containing protein [Terriglobales bacterium]|nr:DUF4097 family beta strand repeat-containing protein [Terriglobales bacterium]
MASTPPVNPAYLPPPPRRRGFFGPMLLIAAGVIFLLVSVGVVTARVAFSLFARYWPVLLILWGVLRLVEYMQAKNEGTQPRGIGAGGVIGLIFLVIFGLATSAAYRASHNVNWNGVRNELDIDNDEFGKFFGQNFEFKDNIDQDFPANATLKVVSDRGDIKLSPSSDGRLHIMVRKVVIADNQDEANAQAQKVLPTITVVDNVLNIDATRTGEWKGAAMHLEILAPKKAYADLMTMRGKLEVLGREGGIKVHNSRGDILVQDITGNADIHMRNGDLNVRKVSGNVAVEGRSGDTKISDVGGSATLQGEIFGGIEFARIGKNVRFKSSRTEMEFAKLDGTITLDHGEMRGNAITGPFRLNSRSYDVMLEDVTGDVRVDNSRGEVELHSKLPVGNIEVTNKQGRIRLLVPPAANFQLDARARRGEIESDFELTATSERGEARSTGTINKGGPRVLLTSEHGKIEIRKK